MLRQARRVTNVAVMGAAASAPPGFVGPGDIAGAPAGWWGLRGFSAAYAAPGTNPAVDLVDQGGNNPITINILSNGHLDVASISAWITAHSVTTALVSQVFDQSGNGQHQTQATPFFMPSLVLNAVGSLPGLVFNGSSGMNTAGNFVTQADPYFYSWVAERTGSTTGFNAVLAQSTTEAIGGFMNTADTLLMFDGSFGNVTAADNVFHSVESVYNGASSSFYFDGPTTPTTVNAGSTGLTNTLPMGFGSIPAGGLNLVGVILEAGIWISDKTLVQASLNANKRAYWGI